MTEAAQNQLAIFGNTTDEMPAYLQQTEYGNAGNENVGAEDLALPVLTVLQSTSDEVETVAGARPGHLFHTVTEKCYTTLYALNLKYTKNFAVFRKRTAGGGFHGNFDTLAEANAHVATLPGNPSTYDITETANHTLLLLNEAGEVISPVLMRFKSTGMKKSRKWNSELQMHSGDTAPRFATVWRITTERQTNTHGSWFLPVIEFAGWAPPELFQIAGEHYRAFSTEATAQNTDAATATADTYDAE